MEGSFAVAANHHGFKRARWRRLHNQRIQDFLIAACQNIRIFMRNGRLKPAAAMAAIESGPITRSIAFCGALLYRRAPETINKPMLSAGSLGDFPQRITHMKSLDGRSNEN
jgi:hypothetical protein